MNTSHRLPSPSLLLAAAAGSISSAAQQPPTAAAEASGEDLLQCMVPPGQPLKLARATLPGVGGALVAAQVLEPGELLLSVPEPLWLTARGPHWAAEMAEQLLALRDSGKAEHWIAALPQRAPPLPWLDDWTEEEVAELQDEDVMAEVQHMRRELEDACAALGADQDYAQEDITWALAMVHSRQFLLADQHVIVPGIDLANHSPAPNASVRCVRSPGTCQGRVAEEEVCDPTSLPPPEPSLFQLVAGERGIAAGEEVTIR